MTDTQSEQTTLVDDDEELRAASLSSDAWRQLKRRPLFWLCISIIAILIIASLFPGLFTDQDPQAGDQRNNLQGPSGDHWFGTDLIGRDQFARVVYGTQVSIVISILVTTACAIIALVFGSIAGYYGGMVDTIISRITDVWFAVPIVLGGVVMLQLFEDRNRWTVSLVLITFAWTTMLRLVRGSVIAVKNSDYVDSARALGATNWRIIWRHILPNALTPLLVYGTIFLGSIIAAEAVLTFIGVGLRKPAVSWGLIISDSRGRIQTHAFLLYFPGMVLSAAVFSFILLGDLLRDAFDPRQR